MRIVVDSDTGRKVDYTGVRGYVIVSVVGTEDGSLNVNRDFDMQAGSAEESQIVSDFLKKADEKLKELFPEEKEPESKIWVPA